MLYAQGTLQWLAHLATCIAGGKRSSSTLNTHNTRCHYVEAHVHTLQTFGMSVDIYQTAFESRTTIANCNILNVKNHLDNILHQLDWHVMCDLH